MTRPARRGALFLLLAAVLTGCGIGIDAKTPSASDRQQERAVHFINSWPQKP